MIDAVRQDGRFIGGAAPYGYRLVHDRQHHNPGKAIRGQRRAHLEPDRDQAPILQEIFHRILAGDGHTTLINHLTQRAAPPPIRRGSAGWTVKAISAILDNPRCTGYEFWHPYSARRHPCLPPEAYQILVRSDRPAHPALVAIQDFLTVATMRDHPVRPRPSRTSLAEPILLHRISCAICGRTMSVSSKDGRVRYRCRATPGDPAAGHRSSVYVAESRVLAATAPWLRQQSETCPSWAEDRLALHAMIDAVNLRITYDHGTDSIHATTGIGRQMAFRLTRD
ncbi:recombinase family protein [Nakamurella multipartita]|nr:recombinase family protein [Nakamurella multipartita]